MKFLLFILTIIEQKMQDKGKFFRVCILVIMLLIYCECQNNTYSKGQLKKDEQALSKKKINVYSNQPQKVLKQIQIKGKNIKETQKKQVKQQQQQIKQKSQQPQYSLKKQFYNIKNKGSILGFSQQFFVQINQTQYTNLSNYQILDQIGLIQKIQLGTVYDYANITGKIDFKVLYQKLVNSISYQLISFDYDNSLDKKKQFIDIGNMTQKQIDQYIQKVIGPQDKLFNLASNILKQPNNSTVLKAEYLHFDKKYKIGSIKVENPICIISAGYKVFQSNKYRQYFQSLQKQNYTNFHIVYVDDNSPENDTSKIIKYLNESNFSIKNKIIIVYNQQHLGALANKHIWSLKYCNQNDIIIDLDPDDGLVGTQTLNVINSVYQNPKIWFVYSNMIQGYDLTKLKKGKASQITKNTKYYRFNQWKFTHIRTFRKNIYQKIPLYMLLQYHYNKTNGNAFPVFYQSAEDNFKLYSLLQLAGNNRIKFVDQLLYYYSGPNSFKLNCGRQHQILDEKKARLKMPLNRLNSIQQKPIQQKQSSKFQQLFSQYKMWYIRYTSCLKRLKKT